MTYTTQQLQGMSDFQRNHAIALKLYPGATVVPSWPGCSSVTIVTGEFTKIMVDYCNNPNDIMPIAFERKIGLMFNWNVENKWSAVSAKDYDDDKPLRAIACLLLLMED